MPKPASLETRNAAIRDYLAGESSTVVAKRHKVSPESVTRWVRESGHKVRTRGGKEHEAEVLAYHGGWVRRGLIEVPLVPERRSA